MDIIQSNVQLNHEFEKTYLRKESKHQHPLTQITNKVQLFRYCFFKLFKCPVPSTFCYTYQCKATSTFRPLKSV